MVLGGWFPAGWFPSWGRRVARKPATDAAISLEPSMPILMPEGGRSAARWSRARRRKVGVGGLDLGYAEGGLDGKCRYGTGSVEAVGGEGLEVGGDAGSGGGIVACDG